MTMHDDSFERLMREARRGYHAPPEPPLDRMWEAIDEAHFGAAAPLTLARAGLPAGRRVSWWVAVAGIAAALVLGVGLGRISVRIADAGRGAELASREADPDQATHFGVGEPYSEATTQYLGRTAALLSALPVDTRAAGGPVSDRRFVSQATDLLSVTRLLLDSPASSDPRLKSLLEDLELVLAQIARLPARRDSTELDLIRMALEQRDVVLRLRSVAADFAAAGGN
jgi:hypothetical protein